MYIRAVHSWEQMRTTKTNKCESCISYGSMDNKMVLVCQVVDNGWGSKREREINIFNIHKRPIARRVSTRNQSFEHSQFNCNL